MKRRGRNKIGVIYAKEIVETLRDRRTLAAMVLVPMVAYPLTLILTTQSIASEQRAGAAADIVVATLRPVPERVEHALQKREGFRIIVPDVRSADPIDGARLALEAGADVALTASATAAEALDAQGSAELFLYYDATSPHAEAKRDRVENALRHLSDTLIAERLRAANLPTTTSEPILLTIKSVASQSDLGGQLLGTILPALVLLFIALSSFYPAVDITAGEKERRTLSTLLTAPVSTRDIVWGKYLAVVTVGTLAGLLNVLVLGLTLLRIVAGAQDGAELNISLSASTWLGLLFTVVMVAAPVGAIMLFAACLARSFRDASYLLTPVLLVCALPAGFSLFPGAELTPAWALVPLANATLLMKALLTTGAPLGPTIISAISSAVGTATLLLGVSRVFADERVLFSTEGKRADLKGILTDPPPIAVSTALAFAAVVFIINYYGSALADPSQPLAAVALTQILGHVIPPLLLALWMKSRIAPTELLALSPRAPARVWAAALLFGAGAWLGLALPAAWLMELVVPGQQEAAQAFSDALGLEQASVGAMIVVLAILPAVAEELAFRGALFGLFSRALAPTSALIAQAAVFGLFHGSVHRFLPTALLGLGLGVLARASGSIWPGVWAHAATNATLLLLESFAPPEVVETISSPTPWALFGVALLVGAWALSRPRVERDEATRA